MNYDFNLHFLITSNVAAPFHLLINPSLSCETPACSSLSLIVSLWSLVFFLLIYGSVTFILTQVLCLLSGFLQPVARPFALFSRSLRSRSARVADVQAVTSPM